MKVHELFFYEIVWNITLKIQVLLVSQEGGGLNGFIFFIVEPV